MDIPDQDMAEKDAMYLSLCRGNQQVINLAVCFLELKKQLEDIRTYKSVMGRPCPLCEYQNGKFIKACNYHEEMKRPSDEWYRNKILSAGDSEPSVVGTESYKIEICYDGTKIKHKLYDTEKTFTRWWTHHSNYSEYFNKQVGKIGYTLKGYINGELVKEYPKPYRINVACPDDLNWDDLQDAQDPNECR